MTTFRLHLWHALWMAGLLPVPHLFRRSHEELGRQGAAEQARLSDCLGPEMWSALMSAWRRPHADVLCSYQLGSGRMQTEFTIAPLNLPGDLHEEIVRLGALGNLIVALYDDLLDENPDLSLLTRADLLSAIERPDTDAAPQHHAVAHLVGQYFRQLSTLPVMEGRAAVRRCLDRAIVTMYDAEQQTQTGASALQLAVRRKSALPAVVMGLPAWLVSPEFDPRRCGRHLRWLYAFGDFCGLIDDALDLEQDSLTGHPNCVQTWLDTAGPENASRVAARIAGYGRRVLSTWRASTDHVDALPAHTTEALSVCLGIAFGGAAAAASITE